MVFTTNRRPDFLHRVLSERRKDRGFSMEREGLRNTSFRIQRAVMNLGRTLTIEECSGEMRKIHLDYSHSNKNKGQLYFETFKISHFNFYPARNTYGFLPFCPRLCCLTSVYSPSTDSCPLLLPLFEFSVFPNALPLPVRRRNQVGVGTELYTFPSVLSTPKRNTQASFREIYRGDSDKKQTNK